MEMTREDFLLQMNRENTPNGKRKIIQKGLIQAFGDAMDGVSKSECVFGGATHAEYLSAMGKIAQGYAKLDRP